MLEQLRRSLFGYEPVHGQETATEGIEHRVFVLFFLFVSLLAPIHVQEITINTCRSGPKC